MPDNDRQRLYLVTPPVGDPAEVAPSLAAALACADVAAVLLRLAPAPERDLIACVKAIAPVVQGAGAALVVDGHPDIVARGGADGAHLSGPAALSQSLPGLKPNFIAGLGGVRTRHDAMVGAETGADYVMFGEPSPDGGRPPFEALVERVAWWAELFETPCVAYAATLDEIAPLAAAGADFVALGDEMLADPGAMTATVREAVARLAQRETVR